MKNILIILLILSSFFAFSQAPKKVQFASTPVPSSNTFAYTNNGLWFDSVIRAIKYKGDIDTTLIGFDNDGYGYKITKPMIQGWVSLSIPDTIASKRFVDSFINSIPVFVVDSSYWASISYVNTSISNLNIGQYVTRPELSDSLNAHHHVIYVEHYTDQYGYTDSAIWAASQVADTGDIIDGGGKWYTMYNSYVPKPFTTTRNIYLKRVDEIRTTLTANAPIGSNVFKVFDVSQFKAGDEILIHTLGDTAGVNQQNGLVIQKISNDTIYTTTSTTLAAFVSGDIIIKNFTIVKPTLRYVSVSDSLVPIKYYFEKCIFDGNGKKQYFKNWTTGSNIFGYNASFDKCIFQNTAAENIAGHGMNILNSWGYHLNGSFFHSSAFASEIANGQMHSIVDNCHIYYVTQRPDLVGHGEAAWTFSSSPGWVTISNNQIYHGNTCWSFWASVPQQTNTGSTNIVVSGNLFQNFYQIQTNPVFLCDGCPEAGMVRYKSGNASITGNVFRNCGDSVKNNWNKPPILALLDTASYQYSWTGNTLSDGTGIVEPPHFRWLSNTSGFNVLRTSNPLYIGNKYLPHIQIDNGRMAVGNRLHRTSLFANGQILEVDNNVTIRAGGTAATSSAQLRLCRYGTVDTLTFSIAARMDSITHVFHMKRIEFYNPATGLNKFTIFHDGIGNTTNNAWYLKAGQSGNEYNVAEIAAFGGSDGYIKIPPSAPYWSALGPNFQSDYIAITGSSSGFLAFGYNNTLRAYMRTGAGPTNSLWQLISGTGKSLMSLDVNDRVAFGTTTASNTWDFVGNVAADSLRLKGNIASGAMTDSILVHNSTDKYLKKLRPANDFLLQSDTSNNKITTQHELSQALASYLLKSDSSLYTSVSRFLDSVNALKTLIAGGGTSYTWRWGINESGGIVDVDSSEVPSWYSLDTFATNIYSALPNISTKQNFTDTSTWDATKFWSLGQFYTINDIDDLLDGKINLSDSNSLWVTRFQHDDSMETIRVWAEANFLSSFTELDPVFTAHVVFGIDATDISNWNAAFGWGNHASAGYEVSSNKSTNTSLGTSNTLYPTQNAVKTYVDNGLGTKQNSLGFTPEDVANKSTSTSLGTSNTLYPSQNAVKTYVDNAVSPKADKTLTTNQQTGTSYTIQASDLGKIVEFNNGSAIACTLPSGLGAGFWCIIKQVGAGQVTLGASGTTIHNADSYTKTKKQYASFVITHENASETYTTQGYME